MALVFLGGMGFFYGGGFFGFLESGSLGSVFSLPVVPLSVIFLSVIFSGFALIKFCFICTGTAGFLWPPKFNVLNMCLAPMGLSLLSLIPETPGVLMSRLAFTPKFIPVLFFFGGSFPFVSKLWLDLFLDKTSGPMILILITR